MVATRIIVVVLIRNGIVVQSIQFSRYLPVGKPNIVIKYLDQWGIDEIVLLDITGCMLRKCLIAPRLSTYLQHCHSPVAVGGGIRTLKDIENCIRSGADKVVLNSAAVESPKLIKAGAREFGSQAIVASIDAKLINGDYRVVTNSGDKIRSYRPSEFAVIAESFGAGEIFLNSIDRDGSKEGYDLTLIGQVVDSVGIPVVACGGAGSPGHFMDVVNIRLSGVAASNYFHFSEHSVISLKRSLKSSQYKGEIRLGPAGDSAEWMTNSNGRAEKRSEQYLERLKYEEYRDALI